MLSECAFYSAVTLYLCVRLFKVTISVCSCVECFVNSAALLRNALKICTKKKTKKKTFGHFNQAGY